MPAGALALVVLAGLIHAGWNVVAKQAGGDARFAFFTALVLMAVWTPLGGYMAWQQLAHWGVLEWAFVAASGLVHVIYYVVLLRGYRMADLTVVYPVARGTGPLLSSLVAITCLGEGLSLLAALGLGAVVLGVFFIADGSRLWRGAGDVQQSARLLVGLRYGFLTGVCIATYTVIDGYAVKFLLLSPILLDYVGNLVRVLLLAPVALHDRAATRTLWRKQWKHALVVGTISPVSYVLVLYAMQVAPLSHVAPAREVSMLFAALFGGRLLGEGDRTARLCGAALIALGVIGLGHG